MQSPKQSPSEFANHMRDKTVKSDFDSFATEEVQFINRMTNDHIKTKLLTKEDIKLDEAVSHLKISEEIRSTVKSIDENETCHRVNRLRSQTKNPWSRCGLKNKDNQKCRFKSQKCFSVESKVTLQKCAGESEKE